MAFAARQIMWPVVEEHLDEAEFLYVQWERSLLAPCTLSETAEWEERLLAHVDGLVQAGPGAAESALAKAVARENESRAFASALAVLQGAASGYVVNLLQTGAMPKPLLRALALSPRAPDVSPLLESSAAADVARALETLAFRRAARARDVGPYLESREPAVAVAALRAARFTGREFGNQVAHALDSPYVEVRDVAIEAGLCLGLRQALGAARSAVDSKQLASVLPLWALACSGEDRDLDRLEALLTDKEWRAPALFALGASGRPRAIDTIMLFLGHPTLARIAGEVVTSITGLAIEAEYCQPPADSEPTQEAIPIDPSDLCDLTAAELALPLPNAEAVERWWKTARGGFDATKRYLRGMEFGRNAVEAALLHGPMRRRHALFFELAVRTAGAFALESMTWARDQQDLSGLSALSPDALAPFRKLLMR